MLTIIKLSGEGDMAASRAANLHRVRTLDDTDLTYFLGEFRDGAVGMYLALPTAGEPAYPYPRDAVRAAWTRHPNIALPAWCSHAEPGLGLGTTLPGSRWVGDYYVAIRSSASASDDDGSDLYYLEPGTRSYDCAHCAAASAQGITGDWVVVMATPGCVPTVYMRPEGEFAGTSVSWDTVVAANLVPARSCSTCGLPGHNAASCEIRQPYIDRVGIEIEGHWRNTRDAYDTLTSSVHEAGIRCCSDSSVRPPSGFFGLEIQTAPGTLREAISQLVEFYPQHTGSDCGMHVHVSFRDATLVSTLNTPEFFAYFRAQWEAFIREHNLSPVGQLARRLRGENDYTDVNRDDEAEYESFGRQDRYRQINFAAWHEHKTVEFRLLPMFVHAEVGVKAICHLIRLLNVWFNDAADILPPFADVTAALDPGDLPLTALGAALDFPLEDDPSLPITWCTEMVTEVANVTPPAPGMRRVALSESELNAFLALIGQERAA